jgi:hypothetical protein
VVIDVTVVFASSPFTAPPTAIDAQTGEIDRAGAHAIVDPRDRRCSQESGDRRLVVVFVVA